MNTATARKLAAIAALAPSADNCQPWVLRWNGSALAIEYAPRQPELQVFGAGSHATLLAIGALVANLESAIATNGMSATWEWSARPEDGSPYAVVTLRGAPAHFTAPEGPMRRHTNRETYRRDPLPPEVARAVDGRRTNDNRVTLLTDRRSRSTVTRLVRIASEARFCNRELHRWLIGSLRHTPEAVARGDGLDVRTLGLPAGGAQLLRFIGDWPRLNALNRFGVYKLLALSEIGPFGAAPGLLCVAGRSEPRSIIDAGSLLARVWTDLNLLGIAVQPYYVVTDQIGRLRDGALPPGFAPRIAEVEHEVGRLLQLQPGERLHMILRVGRPRSEPMRSRRLPLDAVFVNATAATRDG
jgi:hypothetical protein